ncbi:amidase [Marinibaculum pumilum]|uniref:Amidase n=1 Tax=Marinibaculum pumilum TaxID=1766165 RepID=A0ABV7L9H9_9PROT
MSVPLHLLTAEALAEAYRAGSLSPVEATEAALSRIEALDPVYNAWCHVDRPAALAAARAAEARWRNGTMLSPVDGVPTGIKDLMPAAGWPYRSGSRATDPAPVAEDAPPVARMREAGAVFLGKTTTPEFGWKGVTDSPLTGISRNPWNPERTCGGSSGGAGAAAALGQGALHLGSDGAGSIRMPCGFCGVPGIKQTYGLVGKYPPSIMGSLSHTGPMARSTMDLALMLDVIARMDPRDPYGVPRPVESYAAALRGEPAERPLAGLRIAFSPTLGYARVTPDVAAAVAAAVPVLAEAGAEVEQVERVFDDPLEILAGFWGHGLSQLLDKLGAEKWPLMEPPVVAMGQAAQALSAMDLARLTGRREALCRAMGEFHEHYDLLVTPQLPLTAFTAGLEFPEGSGMQRWWEWSPFTYPFNLTGQPAATVPCGLAPDGLPVALQIVGARFADLDVLRAAQAFERRQPFRMPDPKAA